MNATYERKFDSHRYYSKKTAARTAVSFAEIIICFINAFLAFLGNETVKTVVRVTVSLSCLATLFFVTGFVKVGALSVIPAILIALALLCIVSFLFRGEE